MSLGGLSLDSRGCGLDGKDEVCKHCLRSFTSPNPILAERSHKPMLQRRRPRGLECTICPAAFARGYPHEAAGIVAGRLEQARKDKNHIVVDETMQSVTNYEEFRNTGKVSRKRKDRKGGDGSKGYRRGESMDHFWILRSGPQRV
jgi:hypothetical protein